MGLHPITSLWSAALRRLLLVWWERALAEIDPLHADVPEVVHRVAELRRTTR